MPSASWSMFGLFGYVRPTRHADGHAKPGPRGRQYEPRSASERAKAKAERRASRANRRGR